jgi:signal transduction histidine kinase
MTLARAEPPYGPADLRLALELAARAALAIDNAALYRQSRQAVRTRDEVLRVVAHDLRSPLTTIGLASSMLLDLLPPDGEDRDLAVRQLDTIERAVERAVRLIEDLLDVARLEAGKLTIRPEPVDATAVVAEVVEAHRALAERKSLAIERAGAEALPAVRADRGRLLQILANLIGNAIKFTPAGGRVEVGAAPEDGHVCFRVSDTGPGSPPDQVAHFFEPFWQASGGDRKGAGLGLAICRGLVEAHGGRIEVESEVGRGTTFRFTIPVA